MNLSPLQMGDYRCLKAIRGLVQAATGPETSSDELDCLNRLIKAAELFEIVERERVLYTPYPPPDLPAIREDGVRGQRIPTSSEVG
ncbi:TPA_asm: hypothetical protein vir525_00080 [Caudoviricetes sp. vir525]|nr:TPA_asm: hypothetical protein vir525_00080 [Caudoviricetes sp. vir525]